MKELNLIIKKEKKFHSEYFFQYEKDEERKEYFLKIEEYAKKIEHDIELISDLEIEPIKNEEEIMLERAEKIKALKSIDLNVSKKIGKLTLILKDLIELL